MKNRNISILSVSLSLLFLVLTNSKVEAQTVVKSADSATLSGPKNPDELVGSYNQPRWSADRLFGQNRAYVMPHHELEAEAWFVMKNHRGGEGYEFLFQQEIEYGFAPHLQLDLYINEIKKKNERLDLEGGQIELRWAWADWGRIPLNPTLYFEYHPRKDNSHKAEVRLLLAETLWESWHFVSNLAYELELTREKTFEYAATAGLAHTIFSDGISAGIEGKTEWTDTKATRGNLMREWYLGPSVQIKPTDKMHINLTSIIGLNHKSNYAETFLILGYDI